MLSKLERYYRESGILATDFRCPHKTECSAGCDEFTGPKSAFVSTGCETRELPRVLFLSLDSGSGNKIDAERPPDVVRRQEEVDRYVPGLPKDKHWYRTHELAWYILRHYKPDLRIERSKEFFAHANSAKCCMNKLQRKKANAVLFRNCKPYLKKEIEILDPDILVSQGSEAKLAIHSLVNELVTVFDQFASVVTLNGREVFWLHTYHPSNYGAFNRQRNFNKETNNAEGWIHYSQLVEDHLKKCLTKC